MTDENLEIAQDLYDQADTLTLLHCTYDCIEVDNGTYDCDNCPVWNIAAAMRRKADKLLGIA